METYIFASTLALCLSLINIQAQEPPSFTIERNSYGISDRLIEIDEVDKDSDSFKNDGTCFGTKRNIASRIGETRIRCFSNLEVYFLEGECDGGIGIVAQEDITYPLCSIQNITDILLWGPEGWKEFDYNIDTFLLAELSYKGEELVFQNRRKWDGIFMRIFVNCTLSGIKCITLKFVGSRTYPLPENLADILVTPPPTTAPPTTTSLPTTVLPTTPSTNLPDTDPAVTTQQPTDQSVIVVVTQNAVTVAEQSGQSEKSGNNGLVIGIVIACVILLVLIVVALLYYKKKQRDRKKGGSASDNIYDLKGDSEKSAIIGEEAVYFTPAHLTADEPEYRELEPEYDDPYNSFSAQERPYDVPELNEELPSLSNN